MNANEEEDRDRDDPVMDWALGERLGGDRPRDLVEGVRARLAQGPVANEPRRRAYTQLLVAAFVLLGIGVVLGVALWPRATSGDAPAQTPGHQEPKPVQVYSLADAAALPATTRAVEVIDGDDAVIAALKRLRDLEVLIVREPFHENHGLGLKRVPPTDPKHVTAAAWRDLLSFTKLRTLELSGTLLLARVRSEEIADGLERLPLLSGLALRYLDTDSQLLAVLPRIRGLQCLDLSYNHGFDDSWIEPVLQCRSLVSLSVEGCQQVHGREIARLGELPLLEQIEAASIDGINWRNSGGWLDDTERDVVARAQRRADRLGIGPTDEALAGIAKCAKLRVLNIASGHWSAAGLAQLGACKDLVVLNASGGGQDHSFVASLPPGLERLEVCGDYGDAFCTAVAEHLQRLRHLNIAACYQITDRGLAAVARMPSLRILDMRQMRGLTVGSIATLLAAKQLEDLDVRHCDFITADHVVELRRALPRLQQLEHSVDPAEVEKAAVRAPSLATAGDKGQIENCVRTGIRALQVLGADDECMAALAESKVLEHLVLRPALQETVGPLTPRVAPFTDAGLAQLTRLPTLRALHLDRCRHTTPGALAVIAQLPVLEELGFEVMEIPDALLARLAGTPLKQLHLDGCRGFGSAGVDAIVRMRELRDVSLRFCGHVDEAWLERLAELPKLEKLDLSYIGSHTFFSGLSEFGSHVEPGSGVTARVLIALGKSATLRELSLDYGAVDAVGLRGLQAAPALVSLSLAGTAVRAADLESLPRTLTRLDLRNCRELEQDFAKVLPQATPRLRELALAHTDNLRDAHLHDLRGITSLRVLDLSRCAGLTGGAVDEISALQQLEQLTVSGCASLGTDGLAKLRAMPNLKVLESDAGREERRK